MGLVAFYYSDYNHYNGVMKMTATFCGHAQISQSADVEKWLYAVTLHLIEQGVNIFYLGGYGAFDSLAAAVLRKQKIQHPEIELILVLAYFDTKRDTSGYIAATGRVRGCLLYTSPSPRDG